jgi:hypothetical protein
MDSKDIKHLFQWRVKHETIFPNVGFLAWQILEIIGSQIEIERIFSLARIFTNLRKYCLQLKSIERLISCFWRLPVLSSLRMGRDSCVSELAKSHS